MQTGDRIKQVRIKVGMTQAELAKRLGVTPQAISQYERGIKKPKIGTLRKIATALNCNVGDLDNSLPTIYVDTLLSQNPELEKNFSDAAKNMMQTLYGTTDEWEAKKIIFARWVNNLEEADRKSVFDTIKYLQALNSEGKMTAAERVEELTQIPKYQKKDSTADDEYIIEDE